MTTGDDVITPADDWDLGFSIISGSHMDSLLEPMRSRSILDLSEVAYALDRSRLWRFCGMSDTYLGVVLDPYDEFSELDEDDNIIVVHASVTDCPGRSKKNTRRKCKDCCYLLMANRLLMILLLKISLLIPQNYFFSKWPQIFFF